MGAAGYQDGVAAVIIATDFQMKGELEPAVLFRRVVSYNRRLIFFPPFFYAYT